MVATDGLFVRIRQQMVGQVFQPKPVVSHLLQGTPVNSKSRSLFEMHHLSINIFSTGNWCKGVNVECSKERKIASLRDKQSHTNHLKNGNRYTQLSTKLESDIDKPERWLSSGQMLCERLLCQNGGIKRTRASYAGPSLITVNLEN